MHPFGSCSFFFLPSLLTPLFLPPVLTPTSNNKNYSLIPIHMKSFHWTSDMLFPFPGSPNSTLSPSACQLLLILHIPRQVQFPLLSLCLDDLLLESHSTTLTSFKKKKKNQMTNQMTLYLVYMSVSSCQWSLAWQKTPLSFGNPLPCRVPDWSKGSIIDFWVCQNWHTEAIGGGWKRRIFLPILLLLSRETSISDFSFHVAVSFFYKEVVYFQSHNHLHTLTKSVCA